jgi:hypothetical protein
MASSVTRSEFVSLVAGEIVAGIDHAVEHWLARIEQELAGAGMTALDRVHAVERVLREYKEVTGKTSLRCASA